MPEQVVSIGVYGFSQHSFLHALRESGTNLLLDVRYRRGVRGSEYAWANHKRLEVSLNNAGIAYAHERGLAPTPEIRTAQVTVDQQAMVAKRQRTELSDTFCDAYKSQILGTFDIDAMWTSLPRDAKTVALLCVERSPEACHRSLVSSELQRRYGVPVRHLCPEVSVR